MISDWPGSNVISWLPWKRLYTLVTNRMSDTVSLLQRYVSLALFFLLHRQKVCKTIQTGISLRKLGGFVIPNELTTNDPLPIDF
jgi:hypothetical protein